MTVARRGEQGFALIAAIWFIAVLAFVAVVISGWMSRSLGLASRLQDRLAAHVRLIDAENQLTFDIVTGFFSARGLELPTDSDRSGPLAPASPFGYAFAANTPYIALDDRPYRLGTTQVRLQDDRGLYTLNHPNPVLLDPLLQHFGVPYADQGKLVNRLLDYIGIDGNGLLHAVNGATADDYADAGRPPPRGAPLLTPWEALRVLSWDDYAKLWQGADAMPALTTTGDFVQLNPNTAPEAILATLPGMNDDAAARVVEYRQHFVIDSQVDLDHAAGVAVAVDPMALMFFPANAVDATIAPAKDPLIYRLRIMTTPGQKDPYRIDYVVPMAAADAATKPAGDTPLPRIPEYPPPAAVSPGGG